MLDQSKDKIAISGVTGFIGKELKFFLESNGYIVEPITRSVLKNKTKLLEVIDGCVAVINLAGHSISKRWNEQVKSKIKNSRIEVTSKIVNAIREVQNKPQLLISASAVGIYDSFEVHDEFSTNYANDFLGQVCQDWEAEALKVSEVDGVRLCLVRLGVVLGRNGGAFPKMLKPFKMGVGAIIGDGHQVFPFIHIKDVLSGIWYLLKRDASGGIYNLVAPQMVSNLEFSRALAERLKKPLWLKVPEFALKWVLGEMANMLLTGQKVIPSRLLCDEFYFQYQNLDAVLQDLC